MFNTYRSKMIILFILMLVVFMLISSWISFEISKKVIIKSILLSEETEATILVDYMNDIYEDLSEELYLFASNVLENVNFEIIKIGKDQESINTSIDKINIYFRSILHSSDYFDSIYYLSDDIILGASLNEKVNIRRDTPIHFRELESESDFKQEIVKLLKPVFPSIKPQQLVAAKVEDQAYLVGILDFKEIMKKEKQDIIVMNDQGEVIFSMIRNYKLLNYCEQVCNNMKHESYANSVLDEYIISAIRTKDGTTYVLINDLSDIYMGFHAVRNKLMASNLLLFVIFIYVALVYSRKITKPILDFDRIINNIYDFNTNAALDKYITFYSNKKSIYRDMLFFFSLTFIPIVITILISFFSFRQVILSNRYRAYFDVVVKTGRSIEDKFERYENYMKYLILDQQLQQRLLELLESDAVQESSAEWKSSVSNILLSKGLLEKGVSQVAIFDSDNRVIYRSNEASINVSNGDIISQTRRKGTIIQIKRKNNSRILLLSEIKYLPHGSEKSDIFKILGYIELEIEDVMDQKISFVYSGTAVSSYVIDSNLEVLAQFGGEKYDSEWLRRQIGKNEFNISSYSIIDADQSEVLMARCPIGNTDWMLVSFIYLESLGKDDFAILLYNGVLLLILFIFIILTSRVLGDSMFASIMRIKDEIEKIDSGNSLKLQINEEKYEYEYVALANSFNDMLERLNKLSEELRAKEIENTELEKRRHKTLLTALQGQINPHFLYNIFTSIILLLKDQKIDNAIQMLVATGKLFKSSLYGIQELVDIREEIEHVSNYIEIQKIRYYNLLEYSIDIDEMFYDIRVPKFILQPLVENAIEHGMYEDQVLHIEIGCSQSHGNGEQINITVRDDGKGIPKARLKEIMAKLLEPVNTEHHGLSNVNERIRLQFGEEYGIHIESIENRGTNVKINLPYLKKGGNRNNV